MGTEDINVLPHYQLLQHDDEESLRVLQITDVHLFPKGQSQWFIKSKNRLLHFEPEGYNPTGAVDLVAKLVAQVQPHLVIFTGDIVDGRPFGQANSSAGAWKAVFTQLLEPLGHGESTPICRTVPWTFCPGNHDDDGAPWSRQDLLEVFSLPGCLTPTVTSFHFTFTVGFTSDPDLDSIRVWLFDSGGNNPATRYDTVPQAVVDRYLELNTQLQRCGQELVYLHIPLPEYKDLQYIAGKNHLFDALTRSGGLPNPWRWIPWFVKLLGKHRVVGCSTLNYGLFDAIASAGSVRAMFCGHDHFCDFVALRRGVYLAYGRVSSTTPPSNWEGSGGPLPFEAGCRVVEWQLKQRLLWTWVEVPAGEEPQSRVPLDLSHVDNEKARPTRSWLMLLAFLVFIGAVVCQRWNAAVWNASVSPV